MTLSKHNNGYKSCKIYKRVHVQRFIAQGNVFDCLALCNKGTTLALVQVHLGKNPMILRAIIYRIDHLVRQLLKKPKSLLTH
jgi:hypothetical protein